MEVLTTLQDQRRWPNRLKASLQEHRNQVREDAHPTRRPHLVERMNDLSLAYTERFNRVEDEIKDNLRSLARKAAVIPLNTSDVLSLLDSPIALRDGKTYMGEQDNLILNCILRDAQSRPGRKVMVSGDGAFGDGEVRTLLKNVGIEPSFKQYADFEEWMKTQRKPRPTS